MQPKLKLRVEPKQAVQINKPFVIVIASVLVFIILLAIVSAFSVNKGGKSKDSSQIKISDDKSLKINSEINQLPDDYRDINGIKKYSFSEQSKEMAKLQHQVDELKNAYMLLEQQLRITKTQPVQENIRVDPRIQQAKTSSLVFSGLSTGVDNLVGSDSRHNDNKQSGGSDSAISSEQGRFFKNRTEYEQRLAIMKETDKPTDVIGLHRPFSLISPYQVQRGSVIPATLVTSIDTTVPGPVIAQVRQNIYDTVTGRYLLIPKGSKLLGDYDIRNLKYGQNRISLVFTSLVRPDGSSIILDSPIAHDLQGRAGVVSKIDNHWDQVLGAALVSTALSVGASAAGGSTNIHNETAWNRGFSGAAAGISGVGQSLTNRAMNIPPTITVDSGYQFNIILKKDIILTLYKPL